MLARVPAFSFPLASATAERLGECFPVTSRTAEPLAGSCLVASRTAEPLAGALPPHEWDGLLADMHTHFHFP